jgi:hypothetical protein
MAYACNSSYSRGNCDQEDHSSKPAQANSSVGPFLKILNTYKKRAGGVAQVMKCLPSNEALSSNPSVIKNKK